jgi:phosphate transport system substrate-binding protein
VLTPPAATSQRRGVAVAVAGLSLALTAACGGADAGSTAGSGDAAGGPSGTIQIDGSSTVAPLSEAAAELFQEENPEVQVVVGTSGTGGGFEKFCADQTDIADASRPISEDEIAACEAKGIQFEELTVANDGLAVVVNAQNDWAQCLTVDEVRRIWSPGSEDQVTNWNQVRPSFPDVPLQLFGPGTDSGTFDYFTEAINGEEGASRTDYQPSEDDNFIVQGVQSSPGGTGYLGLSYVEENSDAIRAVEIDGGNGCVAPSAETVQSGEYVPLSRPLYIYAKQELVQRPEGLAFLQFYIENSSEIAEQALYVPLTPEQQQQALEKVQGLQGA